MSTSLRFLVMMLLALMLCACGSSRVVRSTGASDGTGPVRVSTPRYGDSATVRRGDTLYGIATRYGITALDLAAWNGIDPPFTIHPGQRLWLYPGASRGSTPPRTGSVARRPASATPRPATPAATEAPQSSPFAWRWPADGSLIGRYVSGESTKQGIDIAGNGGDPVRSAGDGVVVYSGSGLVGYGELIIVKHNEQWLSAYGHNRARLVNEGQVVKAGQQIAEMGRTGAARDMLHFEIRYNGKPVDPLQYLPKR